MSRRSLNFPTVVALYLLSTAWLNTPLAAQSVTVTPPADSRPFAIAFNPVTNQIDGLGGFPATAAASNFANHQRSTRASSSLPADAQGPISAALGKGRLGLLGSSNRCGIMWGKSTARPGGRKGNAVNGQSLVNQYGAASINTSFATATVSGNVVTDGSVGIFNLSSAPLATVSGNTVADAASGIVTGYDGGVINSNKISNTSTAVDLQSNDATAGSNTITHATVAIDFECNTDTVGSNVINYAMTALDQIPATLVSSNTYDNVDAIRVNCAASNSVRKPVSFKLAGR